jgi:hypothetical protein
LPDEGNYPVVVLSRVQWVYSLFKEDRWGENTMKTLTERVEEPLKAMGRKVRSAAKALAITAVMAVPIAEKTAIVATTAAVSYGCGDCTAYDLMILTGEGEPSAACAAQLAAEAKLGAGDGGVPAEQDEGQGQRTPISTIFDSIVHTKNGVNATVWDGYAYCTGQINAKTFVACDRIALAEEYPISEYFPLDDIACVIVDPRDMRVANGPGANTIASSTNCSYFIPPDLLEQDFCRLETTADFFVLYHEQLVPPEILMGLCPYLVED